MRVYDGTTGGGREKSQILNELSFVVHVCRRLADSADAEASLDALLPDSSASESLSLAEPVSGQRREPETEANQGSYG